MLCSNGAAEVSIFDCCAATVNVSAARRIVSKIFVMRASPLASM
jgi:hypothetical protein